MLTMNNFWAFTFFSVIQSCFTLSLQNPVVKDVSQEGDLLPLNITLLHVNDIHAHFDEINSYTGRCHQDQAKNGECFGGAGRMITKVNEIRDKNPNNTLFLNAGDYYQGTIYYTLFKYEVVTEFANLLNYDAFGVGNHDFDDGSDGLIPFVNDINFPVLAANLDTSNCPELNISKSITLDREGHTIGIIGYITADTPDISTANLTNLKFLDVITSVQEEATRLVDSGVNIIIAMGHAGYEIDTEMASKVKELDLIVGGHSHTFLWTGSDPPSVEQPRGEYPTYVKVEGSDKVIPVVQAYAYGKYIGHLELSFDKEGDLMKPVNGVGVNYALPILLDSSIEMDPAAVDVSTKYRENMTEYTDPVGVTKVLLKLEGYKESNIGNVLTDSMIDAWQGEAEMGFINNGGVRAPIIQGNIAGEDIFNVLPFNNTVDRLTMKGKDIRFQLEKAIEDLCPNKTCYSSFLQVSKGVRLVYRIQAHNQGNRIEKFQVKCDKEWCNVEDDKDYRIVMPSFLATSNYFSVRNFVKNREIGKIDYDAFKDYVEKKEILDEDVDGFGRIIIIYDTDETTTSTPSAGVSTSALRMFLLTTFALIITTKIILQY